MKKRFLALALAAPFALQAQWVNDPASNTLLANSSNDAGEIYLATNAVSGDTYLQWCSFGPNGWSPTLQRVNFEGIPQWGDGGIRIAAHQFSSMSEGLSMTTTTDGAVVSCFANYDGYTYAVKINADGTFPWGEQGIMLFDGQGFSRTELTACTDGGFWALGADYNNSYLQHVAADGSLGIVNTITSDKKCVFGQLTLGKDNSVFLTYEKLGNGFYTDKEIHLVGFNADGTPFAEDVTLMASQSFQSTYIHRVLSDGNDGGYAYIWHSGIDNAFNVYVFHFDNNGVSTIGDPNGITVHSTDPANFYLDAHATVDPISHDLIIAYQQTDASTQSQDRIYMNRITPTGERVWGEGILVADNDGHPHANVKIDAYEDGSGFSIVFEQGLSYMDNTSTMIALGFDMDGNPTWNTTLSASAYGRTICENTTGFLSGQNIVAWVNASNGGLYGQNIQPNGEMGEIAPEPEPCAGPENFEAEYVYDAQTGQYGVKIGWSPVAEEPTLAYYIYRTDLSNNQTTTIEIDGTQSDYFDEVEIGQYKYELQAQYETCGLSLLATTPTGEDHVVVGVTHIGENTSEEIVTVTRIFTLTGQRLNHNRIGELGNGIYLIQGLTKDGQTVNRKIVVNK